MNLCAHKFCSRCGWFGVRTGLLKNGYESNEKKKWGEENAKFAEILPTSSLYDVLSNSKHASVAAQTLCLLPLLRSQTESYQIKMWAAKKCEIDEKSIYKKNEREEIDNYIVYTVTI